jgi:tetratricopeptide (TPR) repeat protein
VTTSESALDAEELMHLALRALDADANEEAITFLKRALVLAPNDGRLHFLLGAVHAEIGLDERAIVELSRAVELAPELLTAHFQLGALFLRRGDADRAAQAWRPLAALDRNHPLARFTSALTRLAEGDYTQCIAQLRQGLASDAVEDALRAEMHEVLSRAEAFVAAGNQVPPAPSALDSDRASSPSRERKDFDSHHVLLAGYEQPTAPKR